MKIKKKIMIFVITLITVLSLNIVSFADPVGVDDNVTNGTGGVQPKTTANAGGTYSAPPSSEDGVIDIKIPQSDQKALGEIAEKINSSEKGGQQPLQSDNPDVTLNGTAFQVTEGSIKFNSKEFAQADKKSSKQNLSVFVEELKNSQVSDATQQYIFDLIRQQNTSASVMLIPMIMDSTKADTYTAMRVMSPLSEFIRVLLGMGAITVVFVLVITTIIDLLYLSFPYGRNSGQKPSAVSLEAYSALKECESSITSSGNFKSQHLIYAKRKAFSFIIVSFCLVYLVAGELSSIVAWFLSLASGLL
ncbi:hypothetical protein [Clostridioides difficile]|uniref:hypothetical protein n=1 Tax=Clostridioides difficile TaxID=1496 RepID=UPI001033F17B|nr:hypothetical protein [Clostridioides difficile]MDM9944009.1 hypothetical protein [Clostridioides difficile]